MSNNYKDSNYRGSYDKLMHDSNKERESLEGFVFGKIQPQALPLEEAILGAILLDKEAIYSVVNLLKVESFYTEAHQKIYAACLECMKASKPIDLLTVTEQLQKMGAIEIIGGSYHLVEITKRVASAANIEAHARIVVEKHIKRELIKSATSIVRDAYEDQTDTFDLVERFQMDAMKVTDIITEQSVSMAQHYDSFLENLNVEKTEGLQGVSSGLDEVDGILGGFKPDDLIIIAARPSMGKTNLMLKVARAAIEEGKKVGIWSLEMSADKLLERISSAEVSIDFGRLQNKQLFDIEKQNISQFVEKLKKESNLYIDDGGSLSIFGLRTKARKQKMQHGLDLIIVDYLQLMSNASQGNTRFQNREAEISAISRGLKQLAKELKVPVIALSQLSRAVETRGGSKRPQLSDLRESGAIEQDADIVSFIYRPEYYKIMEDADGNTTANTAEIIIAKHRNGILGEAIVGTAFANCDFTNKNDALNQFNALLNANTQYPTPLQKDVRQTFGEGADPNDSTITAMPKGNNEEEIPF